MARQISGIERGASDVSFGRVFRTCLSDVSFGRVFRTCLSDVSFGRDFRTCSFGRVVSDV